MTVMDATRKMVKFLPRIRAVLSRLRGILLTSAVKAAILCEIADQGVVVAGVLDDVGGQGDFGFALEVFEFVLRAVNLLGLIGVVEIDQVLRRWPLSGIDGQENVGGWCGKSVHIGFSPATCLISPLL